MIFEIQSYVRSSRINWIFLLKQNEKKIFFLGLESLWNKISTTLNLLQLLSDRVYRLLILHSHCFDCEAFHPSDMDLVLLALVLCLLKFALNKNGQTFHQTSLWQSFLSQFIWVQPLLVLQLSRLLPPASCRILLKSICLFPVSFAFATITFSSVIRNFIDNSALTDRYRA